MCLSLSMSGQAKMEGGNTHLNIAGMPESAQTSAEGVPNRIPSIPEKVEPN